MLVSKVLFCLVALRALSAFSRTTTPPPATPDPGCALIVNKTLHNASSWTSERIVDVAHTRSGRIRNRYEDDTVRHSSHVARSSRATRCSHSLLVGRRFCGKLDWAAPTQVRFEPPGTHVGQTYQEHGAGHIYYHFSSGHYTYEPDLCVLRRLGRDEAQACMADVGPVLFAGDSVTRYQYMTFVHHLASGKYQHPFDGSQSLSNAHTHRETGGASSYDALWAHSKHEVEKHSSGGSGLYYNHDRGKELEHAHLTLALRKDKHRKAHVYYCYMANGSDEIKGVIAWAMRKRQDWRYLILNVCAHYGKDYIGAISRHVISAMEWANQTYGKAFAEAGTQLVWKSCTTPQASVRKKVDEQERVIAEYAVTAGVPVFDTRTVAKSATAQHLVTTWDDSTVHYLQFMYEQWNDLLLNILCPVRDGVGDAADATEAYDGEGVPPPSGAEGD